MSFLESPEVWQIALMSAGVILAVSISGWLTRSSIKKLIKREAFLTRQHAAGCLIDIFLEIRDGADSTVNEQKALDKKFERYAMQIKLIPQPGAKLLVDWSSRIIKDLKRELYGFDATRVTQDFRDLLALWIRKPRRAIKEINRDLAVRQGLVNERVNSSGRADAKEDDIFASQKLPEKYEQFTGQSPHFSEQVAGKAAQNNPSKYIDQQVNSAAPQNVAYSEDEPVDYGYNQAGTNSAYPRFSETHKSDRKNNSGVYDNYSERPENYSAENYRQPQSADYAVPGIEEEFEPYKMRPGFDTSARNILRQVKETQANIK